MIGLHEAVVISGLSLCQAWLLLPWKSRMGTTRHTHPSVDTTKDLQGVPTEFSPSTVRRTWVLILTPLTPAVSPWVVE